LSSDYQWPSGSLQVPPRYLTDDSASRKKITQELESFFSKKFGYPCILLPSGRSAISLSMMALKIDRHHIVFAPQYSSYCVWNILGRFSNPSVTISKDTDLILAVHKYAEVQTLDQSIADALIIEDSCDSLIVSSDNMFPLGGAYEVFSLPKIMGTYAGGVLACRNVEYENKAREIIKSSIQIHDSQGYLRWQFSLDQSDSYNLWEANEFQNFYLDLTALNQIYDNLEALDLNQKVIESRFHCLAEEHSELSLQIPAGRLPSVLAFSRTFEKTDLMQRMIDIKQCLHSPSFANHVILPLHFGVSEEHFLKYMRSFLKH